jgi:hypothetical protein
MNRRHILNSAVCLIPGRSILQSHANSSFSILASQNDKLMLDLLLICLDRIDWQGEVSEWRTRIFQVIDRIQSVIKGEGPGFEALLMTAHQMNVTADLCRVAQTGRKDKIIKCALRFGNAFNIRIILKNYGSQVENKMHNINS